MASKFLKRTLSVVMCVALIASMFAMSVSVAADTETADYSSYATLTNRPTQTRLFVTGFNPGLWSDKDVNGKYGLYVGAVAAGNVNNGNVANPVFVAFNTPDGKQATEFNMTSSEDFSNVEIEEGKNIDTQLNVAQLGSANAGIVVAEDEGGFYVFRLGTLYKQYQYKVAYVPKSYSNVGTNERTGVYRPNGATVLAGGQITCVSGTINNDDGTTEEVAADKLPNASNALETQLPSDLVNFKVNYNVKYENNIVTVKVSCDYRPGKYEVVNGSQVFQDEYANFTKHYEFAEIKLSADGLTVGDNAVDISDKSVSAVGFTSLFGVANFAFDGLNLVNKYGSNYLTKIYGVIDKADVTYTDAVSCDHSNTQYVGAKEPTCTEKGSTGTKTCKDCGAILEKAQDIPALGHDDSAKTVTKEPTCTVDGEKSYTCSRCGESFVETIAALGHDMGDWEVAKAPTKTETGTEKRTCKREGCDYFETRVIESTGTIVKDYGVGAGSDFSAFKDDVVLGTTNPGKIDKSFVANEDGTMTLRAGSNINDTYAAMNIKGVTPKSFEVQSTIMNNGTLNRWDQAANSTYIGIIVAKGKDADGNDVYFTVRTLFDGSKKPCYQLMALRQGTFRATVAKTDFISATLTDGENNYTELKELCSDIANVNDITSINYVATVGNDGAVTVRATYTLKNGKSAYTEVTVDETTFSAYENFAGFMTGYTTAFGISKTNEIDVGNPAAESGVNFTRVTAKYSRPSDDEIRDFKVSAAQVSIDGTVNLKITVKDANNRFGAAYTTEYGIEVDGVKHPLTASETAGEYTYVVSMAAKDMGKAISAKPYLVDDFGETYYTDKGLDNYSVADNLASIYKTADETEKAKIIAVANYGAAAQKYFGEAGELVNSFLTEEEKAVKADAYKDAADVSAVTISEGTIAGASLKIDDKIALIYYVKNDILDEDAKVEITVDGKTFEMERQANGSYRFETDKFTPNAANLGKATTVEIKSGDTTLASITYSGYSYISRMANKASTSDSLKELINSLVVLSQVA